ncbi:hypothetical protein [Alloprevotella rava]|uniref:Uncharacterized membrane protein YoaK (UPF0700 family) n=1 Tax=Alloprevotella rava TaxID=671218 RepID=A0A7W5YDP7_9BACT|nr:hypothetical protein [Alloprevotella rava]MBB3702474.1 uncharacterized membrane protein YoaK (UPF0700 family) [Alloprevotella rava]
MNLQSILLLLLIVAIVVGVLTKKILEHRHNKKKCETCHAQGCALKELLNKE